MIVPSWKFDEFKDVLQTEMEKIGGIPLDLLIETNLAVPCKKKSGTYEVKLPSKIDDTNLVYEIHCTADGFVRKDSLYLHISDKPAKSIELTRWTKYGEKSNLDDLSISQKETILKFVDELSAYCRSQIVHIKGAEDESQAIFNVSGRKIFQ
jgi:hypothetical protein